MPGAVQPGRGATLRDGADAILFAYGPVMLHEALTASELLEETGLGLAVVALPWLNRLDGAWLAETAERYAHVFVLEDHAPVGGLGDAVRRELEARTVTVFGVEGWPACGTPAEALSAHRVDGASLVSRITGMLGAREG
jgi:transketolase